MGKKGSWFSALKKALTHSSKDQVADGTGKKSSKEKKKKGVGKLKHGDGYSFIPLFREPSSIEKILGEAERELQINNYGPHLTPSPSYATQSNPIPINATHPAPRRVPSLPPQRVASPPPRVTPVNAITPTRAPSPKTVRQWRPEPTLKNQHICATKIQTAYRCYMARNRYRALRGQVRLQGVINGKSVKRQTANALKCMQMLVRVQTEIQATRVHMLENQRQASNSNEKDQESAFAKWRSENQEDWDDSTLTKEEIEARMQRKFDAVVKRERAMAYAYSHQPWKSTPRIGHGALANFSTEGHLYWWNWLQQRKPPPMTPAINVSKSPVMKKFHLTPTRPTMNFKASPFSQSSNTDQPSIRFDNLNTPTPKSTRSSIPVKTQQARTPPSQTFRDNDSLTSCPPFSVPRYMSSTVSTQARFPDSPGSVKSDVSKRRSSFISGQVAGSFKWNKGSFFSNKETKSQKGLGKNKTAQSVGNLSIDSSTSMPASIGRKPFNRFV